MLAPFKPHCGWKSLQRYYWFGNQVIEKTLSTTHHWGIFPPKHKQQIFERSSAPFSHKEYHPDLFLFFKKKREKRPAGGFFGRRENTHSPFSIHSTHHTDEFQTMDTWWFFHCLICLKGLDSWLIGFATRWLEIEWS